MHLIYTHPFILSFLDCTSGSLYIVSFSYFVVSVLCCDKSMSRPVLCTGVCERLRWVELAVRLRQMSRLSSGNYLPKRRLRFKGRLNGGGGHKRGALRTSSSVEGTASSGRIENDSRVKLLVTCSKLKTRALLVSI